MSMKIPVSVRAPKGDNLLMPDPNNKDLDSVYNPTTNIAYWVETVEIMPDGTPIVWLKNASWLYVKELVYDSNRKQFIYPREY